MDFMPVAGDRVTDRHRLVRMLRMVRGTMRFHADCRPRFNYGRDPHEFEEHPGGDPDAILARFLAEVERVHTKLAARGAECGVRVENRGGRFALRGCVLNYRTTLRDMEILLDDLRRVASLPSSV